GLGAGSLVRVDLNRVSDDGVLRTYEDTSSRRLAQRADTNVFYAKSWPDWNFVARAYAYQDLTTAQPVELQRVPELSLQGVRQPVPGLTGFLYEVNTSATRFFRELGSEGTRVDLHPRLSRPIPLAGYATLTPFAGGRLTYYDRTVTDTGFVDGIFVERTAARDRVRELAELGADAETRATRVFPTDVAVSMPRVTANVGTRYDRRQAFIPEFVEIPETWNPGGEVPDRASVNFVQAGVTAELFPNLEVRASTNWDVRSDTFVESRFGID